VGKKENKHKGKPSNQRFFYFLLKKRKKKRELFVFILIYIPFWIFGFLFFPEILGLIISVYLPLPSPLRQNSYVQSRIPFWSS